LVVKQREVSRMDLKVTQSADHALSLNEPQGSLSEAGPVGSIRPGIRPRLLAANKRGAPYYFGEEVRALKYFSLVTSLPFFIVLETFFAVQTAATSQL
jgi:hypothetical protein